MGVGAGGGRADDKQCQWHPERDKGGGGGDRGWALWQASGALGRLFRMMAPNQRFSQDCTSHCSSYKLKPIWRDNNISLGSKVKLLRSLVICIFLYACESWTLTAELEKRTQAFEMRCYRRLLNISYGDHVTNEEVRGDIQAAIGEYDELLTLVGKRKLRWFGHVSRSSGLAKTILQGTVKGKRKRGRQKKRWEDNIKEWTGMDFAGSTRAAENRSRWKGIVANSSVVPRRPSKVMG